MANRSYGQHCGMAHALDVVGDRWALMIVRDLLVEPHRFTDLRRGLVGIPTNILTSRLKQLEAGGVVRRALLPRPDSGTVYELTEYGRDLEDVVLALGRWGSRSLGEPADGEVVTPASMTMAFRTVFQPDEADGVEAVYRVVLGPVELSVAVDGRALEVHPGAPADPDLTIVADPRLRAVMTGELTPADALASASVTLDGDESLFDDFCRMFRILDPVAPAA